MKTRKQKDNNQRLNFLRHESNNLLAQYYKKKTNLRSLAKGPQTSGGFAADAGFQSVGSRYAEGLAVKVQNPKEFGTPQGFQKVPLDLFRYPKSLTSFYNKYKEIKPLVVLNAAVATLDTPLASQGTQALSPLQITGLRMCYMTKVKAKNSKVRIRGRCIQSNRPRSVSRLLRMSRIRIRSLALEGHVTGCTRAT